MVPSVDLRITSVNGTEWEKKGVEQVRRIVATYDVTRWAFTDVIQIESMAIPHSHPVLTLNTRNLDNDLDQLATFLHEQFHWWVSSREEATTSAISDFEAMFPDAPSRSGGGAKNQYSTYLHFIVCDLEYQALSDVLGVDKARAILGAKGYYTWIYERVLARHEIRSINAKHGFLALWAGPGPKLQIRTAAGTVAERETAERVRELFVTHDLSRFLFTGEIIVEEGVIPHSHPVLTLAPRSGDALLADLIHEQIHWLEEAMPEQRDAAMAVFKELYPEVPVRGGQGARDTESTYLHLIVCDVEYQALTQVIGVERAEKVLREAQHYRWIYDKVLDSEDIRAVNRRYGFELPE